jgi:hypothetical protein
LFGWSLRTKRRLRSEIYTAPQVGQTNSFFGGTATIDSDLKGGVSGKIASLEQKGRTDSHSRQASLLEKEVMRNREHLNQCEKFDRGHHSSDFLLDLR